MRHPVIRSQCKKLSQLGQVVLVTMILTVGLFKWIDAVGQLGVQAQEVTRQASDTRAQQSASHQWVTETIDTDGSWTPSMVLDQYQKSHVAYQCEAGSCYAVRSGTKWLTETIAPALWGDVSLALDAAGRAHVGIGNGSLSYAYFDGVNWTVETVEGYAGAGLGRNLALALDAAGHPHITYYGPQPSWDPTDFRHAYYDGSQWITETIAGGAQGNGAGVSSGLLIDSSGHLHSLYDGGSVTYAYFDGSSWSTQPIASGFGGSLAIAPNGSLHVSFISHPSGADDWYHLKYASLGDSGWVVREVARIATESFVSLAAPSGFVWPGATSLQMDGLGTPRVAFFNATDWSAGYLRYARFDGSEWAFETIDTQGTPGWAHLSLALDPSGYARVAYLGDWHSGGREVRYAYALRSVISVLPGMEATLVHTGSQSLQTVTHVASGAVSEQIEMVFTERDYAPRPPTGLAFAGQGFQLEAYQSDGTHISSFTFASPATVTVEYSEADVALLPDESTLELHWWNGDVWDTAGITIVEHDVEANRFVATIPHLSQFAMFGETLQLYLPLTLRGLGT